MLFGAFANVPLWRPLFGTAWLRFGALLVHFWCFLVLPLRFWASFILYKQVFTLRPGILPSRHGSAEFKSQSKVLDHGGAFDAFWCFFVKKLLRFSAKRLMFYVSSFQSVFEMMKKCTFECSKVHFSALLQIHGRGAQDSDRHGSAGLEGFLRKAREIGLFSPTLCFWLDSGTAWQGFWWFLVHFGANSGAFSMLFGHFLLETLLFHPAAGTAQHGGYLSSECALLCTFWCISKSDAVAPTVLVRNVHKSAQKCSKVLKLSTSCVNPLGNLMGSRRHGSEVSEVPECALLSTSWEFLSELAALRPGPARISRFRRLFW